VSGIKIRKQDPLSTVRSTGERVRVRGIKIGSRSDSLIIFGGIVLFSKQKGITSVMNFFTPSP
jgi:hypothetical protein